METAYERREGEVSSKERAGWDREEGVGGSQGREGRAKWRQGRGRGEWTGMGECGERMESGMVKSREAPDTWSKKGEVGRSRGFLK